MDDVCLHYVAYNPSADTVCICFVCSQGLWHLATYCQRSRFKCVINWFRYGGTYRKPTKSNAIAGDKNGLHAVGNVRSAFALFAYSIWNLLWTLWERNSFRLNANAIIMIHSQYSRVHSVAHKICKLHFTKRTFASKLHSVQCVLHTHNAGKIDGSKHYRYNTYVNK